MRRFVAPVLVLALTPYVFAQAAFGNDKAIVPSRLKAHLEFIASDEMEGRDTPSRGLDTAALYLAAQLKLWGAQPAGDDGTFFQRIALDRQTTNAEKSTLSVSGTSFACGPEFIAASRPGKGQGRLVFVDHGWIVKDKGIDPYRGLDVKGKVVIVLPGLPEGVTQDMVDKAAPEAVASPDQAARKLGALAILQVPDKTSLDRWDTLFQRTQRIFSPRISTPQEAIGAVPIVTGSARLLDAVFKGEKSDGATVLSWAMSPVRHEPFELSSPKSIEFDVQTQGELLWTRNVVAVVPGTDAALRKEFVAFGAHYDHVGMRASGTGDRIFNGADDDGSGTVSILEIAHAFLTGPKPKRSLLFVWHCGEEKGLWGSSFFTNHPTVELKSIVAQLNIDMIGRSKKDGDTNPANKVLTGPKEVYVVGSTKMSSDLQKTSEAVNKAFLNLQFNYKYDDPKDTERIFYRSDHYNYARKGIPIIFYFDGVHEDYHRVSDEVQKIDFDKMSRVARTVYATGWTLANAAKRPVVDKPLPD